MGKSKLIDSLKTLDEKEFRRFGMFVSSPFFNTNHTLVKLYDILKMNYPEFKNENIGKEEIFSELYPGIQYKDGTIRNLFSDLTELLHKFFIENELELNINEKNLMLLRQLDKRKLDSSFKNSLNEFESSLNSKSKIGYSFFYFNREFEELKVNFLLERGRQKSICNNILKRSEYSVYNFIIYLLNDIHDLKINEDAYNAKYKFNLAREIADKIDYARVLEIIGKSTPELAGIFKLFLYEGLAFIKIEKDEYYYEFKKMFFENYEKLSRNTINTFFISLENICIEKIFKGNEIFIKEELEVFKEILRRKAYKEDPQKKFSIYLFRNIILTALSNNEINWMEDFLKEYSAELPEEFREDMENFTHGLIYFEMGYYHQALNIISRINDKADIFKLTLYTLKLKIFYEIGELDSAEYLLDSYHHFITQNKTVSDRFKKTNKNFLKAYQILLNAKAQIYGNDKPALLKKLINKEKYFKEKAWLLKKIKNQENSQNS
jgi:hypothetical protein